MRSHQISQITHFRIKYEFSISFKRDIWEKLGKKDGCGGRDINDGIFINENENQQQKQWVREIFLQRESHGAYNILWKELVNTGWGNTL